MKKIVLLFIVFLLVQLVGVSQNNDDTPIPNTITTINYQGIVRDDNGVALSNQPVTIQFDFIDYSAGGTSLYKEEHTVQTNDYGLVSLPIGGGTQLSGYSNIEVRTLWEQADRIEVSADFNDGSGLHVIDNVHLKAVPYAFRSKYEGQTLDSVTVGTKHFIVISDANGQPLDSVALPSSSGGDTDPTNELQQLHGSISSTDTTLNLFIDDASSSNPYNGNQLHLNLRPFLSDDQDLSSSSTGSNVTVNITNGQSTTFSVNDADASTLNEIQDLTLNGSVLNLTQSNGSGVDLSTIITEHPWYQGSSYNYLPGTGNIYFDTIFRGGMVGIGKPFPSSSPIQSLLHIRKNGGVNPPLNFILGNVNQPTKEWVFDVDDLSQLSIKKEGANYPTLFFDNNYEAKVGIGTSSPVAKLDIKTNNNTVDGLYVGNDANTPYLVVENDGTVGIGTSTTNSKLTVRGVSNQDVLFVGQGTNPYLKVIDGGNVGIGLGSPGAKLHVLDNSTNNAVNIKQNNMAGHGLQIDVMTNNSSQNLLYARSSVPNSDFIIKSDGRIGVGMNNPNTNSKLDVNGTIRIESNIDTNGTDYSNTNELNRSTTGDADLLPLAYGKIKNYPITSYPNPVIDGATSNVTSVVYNSSTSVYSISLNQIDFNTTYGYVVFISVEKTLTAPIIPVYSSSGQNLRVTLYDLAGSKVRGNFSFIIYKK